MFIVGNALNIQQTSIKNFMTRFILAKHSFKATANLNLKIEKIRNIK
jgi:hypothetical protein